MMIIISRSHTIEVVGLEQKKEGYGDQPYPKQKGVCQFSALCKLP